MSLDVYINGQLLELSKNKGIGLTLQIGSILNPGNRAGNLSNKFKVPKTRRNTEILGNLSNINSATNIPYKRNAGKIVQDGIEIFPDGFAIVDSTAAQYGVTIYSGNASFFDLIKGANISDLDLSDLYQLWTVSNVISSFNNTEGMIYPIIDWGDGVQLLFNNNLQNSNSLIPVLFLKEALTRIANSVGYEIKGTFPDSDQWDRLLLTPNQFQFLAEEMAENSFIAKDITVINPILLNIISVCNGGIGIFFLNIPLIYQDVSGGSTFSQPGFPNPPQFIPDNTYFGTFLLNIQGDFHSQHIPIKGETIYQSGIVYNDFRETWINDNYSTWVCTRNGFNDINLFVKDINSISAPVLVAQGLFSQNGLTSLTETEGGYIAYSFTASGSFSDVNIYNIATQTITQIYLNPLGNGNVDWVKIWNGKVMIQDRDFTGGIFVYDILTSTLKTLPTISGNDTGGEIDGNGDFLVWEEFSTNNIYIWDYATGTNTLIENGGAFSGMNTCKVLGDYATYWDTSLDKMVSYKISTATLTNIIIDNTKSVQGSARTTTKLSFAYNTGQLFYYDLLTDTLTTPLSETNSTVSGVGDLADRLIDMNENFIVYRYDSNPWFVRAYEIATGIPFQVFTTGGTDSIQWVRIGNCSDIVSANVQGGTDVLYQYDITAGAPITIPFNTITNVQAIRTFGKAIGNDRILIPNDTGLSSSVSDRVSLIEAAVPAPIQPKLEIVIKENGVTIYVATETLINSSSSNNYGLFINTGQIIVNSGDIYTAEVFIEASRDETINYFLEYSVLISSFSFTSICNIPYGANLKIENFYNLKQEIPFKDVMNMYGLTIQTDEISKQVFLTPLDELNNNLSKAKNWNDKINLSRPPSVKYKIGSYAQTNNFIYKKDKDVTEDFGNGSFNIDNFSLPLEKDVVKLNIAAVESGIRLINEVTPTIPVMSGTADCFDKALPRILLLDRITKNMGWKNTINGDVGNSTELPLCYFIKDGKTDNLDFPSLISENYNVLLGMMNQVKFISAGFILTEVDIANLDFTIPIFLDVHYKEIHINGYFYINKISNFKKNNTTKVDLIRL
jgi:hypothetical protein